jgi:hypothetical protein
LLEQRNAALEARATDAESRAAAAKAEEGKAIQRAQNRYTEKMHARNESRNLENLIVRERAERCDFIIKAKRCIAGLNGTITQLQTEKASGSWSIADPSQLQESEQNLEQLQTALEASQAEKTRLTDALEKEKNLRLNSMQEFHTATKQLQAELEVVTQKANITPHAPTEEEIQARIDTKLAELSSIWKVEADTQKQIIVENRKEYQNTLQDMIKKYQQDKQVWDAAGKNIHALHNAETRKKKILEEQLRNINNENQRLKQRLQVVERTMQNNTQEGNAQQIEYNANKRRRQGSIGYFSLTLAKQNCITDSNSTAGVVTPELQRSRTHSLLSNNTPPTPRPILNVNGDIAMPDLSMTMHGGQSGDQQPMVQAQMPPQRAHKLGISQLSNSSAGSVVPHRQLHPQYSHMSFNTLQHRPEGTSPHLQPFHQQYALQQQPQNAQRTNSGAVFMDSNGQIYQTQMQAQPQRQIMGISQMGYPNGQSYFQSPQSEGQHFLQNAISSGPYTSTSNSPGMTGSNTPIQQHNPNIYQQTQPFGSYDTPMTQLLGLDAAREHQKQPPKQAQSQQPMPSQSGQAQHQPSQLAQKAPHLMQGTSKFEDMQTPSNEHGAMLPAPVLPPTTEAQQSGAMQDEEGTKGGEQNTGRYSPALEDLGDVPELDWSSLLDLGDSDK